MEKKPLTILIVDDCPEDRESVKRFLLKDSHNVYTIYEAENAEQGLRLCAETVRPDCILLDYNIPDVDGLEFIEKLTAERYGKNIPIIFLTGQGTEMVAVKAMQLGVMDYIIKNHINADILSRSIAYAVRQKQTEHERDRYIKELEQAVEKIRRLEGLLPICSACKKIRNDNGYWQQVEIYFKHLSGVEFTHSICPDCRQKLYPDLTIGRQEQTKDPE